MAISEVSISNITIGKLGGMPIMTLDDGTTEADLCKANYEPSRDLTLETLDWTFARARAYLTPLAGADAEIHGNDYSNRFQLPPDCLVVRKVSADGSFEDRVDVDKEGRTLVSSESVLYIKYTKRITDPTLFSPGFIQLFAFQLAADICIPLTAKVAQEKSLRERVEELVDHAGGADGVQSKPQKQKAYRTLDARFGRAGIQYDGGIF